MKKNKRKITDDSSNHIGKSHAHKKSTIKTPAIIPRDPTINPEDYLGILPPSDEDIETQREKAWGRKL